MGIPPFTNPDGTTGCNPGYNYDPTTGLCQPVTGKIGVQVLGSNPGQSWTLNDITEAQVDPKVAAQAAGLGWANDGLIERFVTAILHGLLILVKPLLGYWFSIHDAVCAAIAEGLTAAQGEGTPGFYELSAAVVTNLFGVQIDPNALQQQYQNHGRLASITALGSTMINLLAGEFLGSVQTEASIGYNATPGAGLGGLPVGTLSPQQGVAAAAAFMGFGAEFAVREGNTEMVAGIIPYGLGEGVREMAVNVAKSLNLQRMGRIALMPLFRDLVATPLSWAINQQYRPKLFSSIEAITAWLISPAGNFDIETELSSQGYSDPKIQLLQTMHTKRPSFAEYTAIISAGLLADTDAQLALTRDRWDLPGYQLLRLASDIAPARGVSLATARKAVEAYIAGTEQLAVTQDLLATLPFLTPGELANLNTLLNQVTTVATKGAKVHQKRLTVNQWKQAYYAGLATLGQLEDAINAAYPDPVEQQIVLFEDLLGQTEATIKQEKLAVAAAKYGITIPVLPKL